MQSDKCELGFKDLTADQAIQILQFYQQITGASIAQPVEPQSQPAPQPQESVQQPQPTGAFEQVAQEIHATQTAGAGDLDGFGVPYNPDLHSRRGGKTDGKNQDGSWKCKKNGDRQAYEQWAAQHKQAAPQAQQQAAPQAQQPQQPAAGFPAPAPAPSGFPAPAAGFPGAGQSFAQPQQQFVSQADFNALCGEMINRGLLNDESSAWIKSEIGETDEIRINEDPATRTAAYNKMQEVMKAHGVQVA